MSIKQSKSTLAKLLAQENISVQHQKVNTAYFDTQNRVLVLPIWKDMSTDLYDLLVGHEVGHAWETPPEGWHDQVKNHAPAFKSYLNVIEDARIERKIKQRYPGLSACFYRAYDELYKKDFFGVGDRDITKLPLIDRINLRFKIGPFLNIKFSPKEQVYIDRIEKLESWDEVVQISHELFAMRKKEIEELLANIDDGLFSTDPSDEDGDGEESDDYELLDSLDNEELESLTDTAFRNREKDLLSSNSLGFRYADLPVIKPLDYIIDHKRFYDRVDWTELNTGIYNETICNDSTKEEDTLFSEFKRKNSNIIQYIVKEFELRRNAKQHARAKISKTGELDVDSVFKYKFKDDLFKRVTNLPGGKNHGMVMYVDWSGSMVTCLRDTLEQAIVLSEFCRRVNIPYKLFAFTDNPDTIYYVGDAEKIKRTTQTTEGELGLNAFCLMELLSNDMTLKQYNNAVKKLLRIGENIEVHGKGYSCKTIPRSIMPNGTPLNEAIIHACRYVPMFKETYKLDVTNTIILTDGVSNENNYIIRNGVSTRWSEFRQMANTIVVDKTTKISGKSLHTQPITVALLQCLKDLTDTNLVGFFLLPKRGGRNVLNRSFNTLGINSIDDYEYMKFKKNNFYEINNYGYDKYFFLKQENLTLEDEELEITADSSTREAAKAFATMQKSKLTNRVFLNKFVAEIA